MCPGFGNDPQLNGVRRRILEERVAMGSSATVAPGGEQHGARGRRFDRVAEAHRPRGNAHDSGSLIHDLVHADAAFRWRLKRSPVDAIVVMGKQGPMA
jgi:hypothetical protein